MTNENRKNLLSLESYCEDNEINIDDVSGEINEALNSEEGNIIKATGEGYLLSEHVAFQLAENYGDEIYDTVYKLIDSYM